MLESKLKEIAETYDLDFFKLRNMDVTGQLEVIEFYEYLQTKQIGETKK